MKPEATVVLPYPDWDRFFLRIDRNAVQYLVQSICIHVHDQGASSISNDDMVDSIISEISSYLEDKGRAPYDIKVLRKSLLWYIYELIRRLYLTNFVYSQAWLDFRIIPTDPVIIVKITEVLSAEEIQGCEF